MTTVKDLLQPVGIGAVRKDSRRQARAVVIHGCRDGRIVVFKGNLILVDFGKGQRIFSSFTAHHIGNRDRITALPGFVGKDRIRNVRCSQIASLVGSIPVGFKQESLEIIQGVHTFPWYARITIGCRNRLAQARRVQRGSFLLPPVLRKRLVFVVVRRQVVESVESPVVDAVDRN